MNNQTIYLYIRRDIFVYNKDHRYKRNIICYLFGLAQELSPTQIGSKAKLAEPINNDVLNINAPDLDDISLPLISSAIVVVNNVSDSSSPKEAVASQSLTNSSQAIDNETLESKTNEAIAKELFPNPPIRTPTQKPPYRLTEIDWGTRKPSNRAKHSSSQRSHTTNQRVDWKPRSSTQSSVNQRPTNKRELIIEKRDHLRKVIVQTKAHAEKQASLERRTQNVQPHSIKPACDFNRAPPNRSNHHASSANSSTNNHRPSFSNYKAYREHKERTEPSQEQLRAAYEKQREKLRRKNKNRRERAKRDRRLLDSLLASGNFD